MTLKEIITSFRKNEIDFRKFSKLIRQNKNVEKELYETTSFLDEYNSDNLERIYYVANGYTKIQTCPFCGKKLKWSGELNKGFRNTCGDKECESKNRSKLNEGNLRSTNRDSAFIQWQSSVKEINDEIVKEHIKYDKHVDMITNPIIIDYLKNRFEDSSSLLESVQRIEFGVEKKPRCPECGRPVKWVGKKTKLYSQYCSTSCAEKGRMNG